jgi:hypothetical protein
MFRFAACFDTLPEFEGVHQPMATNSMPLGRDAAIDSFHADIRRLDRRDWRLWCMASLVMLLMVSTIAVMALEIEHRGVDFLSGAQLDAAVRGLMTLVLVFSLFVTYQLLLVDRMRSLRMQDLRRELATGHDAHGRASEDSGN